MVTLAASSWIAPLIRKLPRSWLGMLDRWSGRVAQRHLAARRRAEQRRRMRPATVSFTEYRLRPWRD